MHVFTSVRAVVLASLCLAACAPDPLERPRSLAWLELAGDPDASPAELGAALYASLAPASRAALDALAAEASRLTGQPLDGADMIRFEGLDPGLRVRDLRLTPEGRLALTVDRVTGAGARPDQLSLELAQGPETVGLVLPGLRAGGAPSGRQEAP
jgi:hypothetical protein